MATNWVLSRIRAVAIYASVFTLFAGCSLTLPTSAGKTEEKPVATAAKPPNNEPSLGFFLPEGYFSKPPAPVTKADSMLPAKAAPSEVSGSKVAPLFAGGFTQEVVLYASVGNKAYYATGGLDYDRNSLVWETLLRKYRIPYKLITNIEQLEKASLGVLLLPSAAVLSERERNAIAAYRGQGGSVLTSWLTGIRNEQGGLVGVDFMDKVLGVKVVGTTETSPDDGFMIMHGNTPVSHYLLAGERVWLEQVKGWPLLQMAGQNSAASMMPWARTFTPGQAISAISFEEREQLNGKRSRALAFAYPERMWQSADPKAMEAIAHNGLMWLLRQPDAYLGNWPNSYTSAFVIGVDAVDPLVAADLSFAKRIEDAGGRASYYLLSDAAGKSAEAAKKLQAKGHEIGYLADRFEGFSGQSLAVQSKRVDAMQKKLVDLGIETGVAPGFRPPMGSADATTQKLAAEKGFGHYIASMSDTENRLPFVISKLNGASKSLVGIPSTQLGPEEWLDNPDVEDGLQAFLDELALAEDMGGVSFVRVQNQTLMEPDQMDTMFEYLKAKRARMWMTSGAQVADWWRERERLGARLESHSVAPILTVTVSAGMPLKNAVSVVLNVPDLNATVRLVPLVSQGPSAKVSKMDNWRTAVIIDGLLPGIYQWYTYFDKPASVLAK